MHVTCEDCKGTGRDKFGELCNRCDGLGKVLKVPAEDRGDDSPPPKSRE